MMYTLLYSFLLYIVLPLFVVVAVTFIVAILYTPSKTNSNEFPDVGEPEEDRPFTIQIITLFTGSIVSRVITSAADILTLAEEVCHLCEKPVGALRLLSDGVIIDPWAKKWKNMTFRGLKIFAEKTLFVYFLPEHHDQILTTLGPDGTAEAWAELEAKLRITKRQSKSMHDQCAKVEKEKSDLLARNLQIIREREKLAAKHGDLSNEFSLAKKKFKNDAQKHRNEVKKFALDKRNLQKKLKATTGKLQDVLLERDRLTKTERQLRHQVERISNDRVLFQQQHEQDVAEREEIEKECQYLRQRLKSLSYANASIDVNGHHHHHHHHHHLPKNRYTDFSCRRPSSTPSETGNESLHSIPLSDHPTPQNSSSEHSSPWSSASSGSRYSDDRRTTNTDSPKLTIIDDSHYASPTILPATSLDETSHRYKDTSRYQVPSFIQNRQPGSSPKSYCFDY